MNVIKQIDNIKHEQITRYGAYGIIIQESKLLLTQKNSGPYKGLWGLPGGAIEFGETPEITLEREIQEETALLAKQLKLLTVMTNYGSYLYDGKEIQVHHIGIIYRVHDFLFLTDIIPEEKKRWIDIQEIMPQELTPFAKQAWSQKLLEKN